MPTYDYICPSCGHEIEVMHSVHGQGPACPSCGGAMKKAISAPAVHFRGTGWARKEKATAGPVKTGSKELVPSGAPDGGSGSSGASGSSAGGSSGESAGGSSGESAGGSAPKGTD